MKTHGVQRIAILLKDPDTVDKAVALYSELLSTSFHYSPAAPPDGIYNAWSYDAGIEMIAPIADSDGEWAPILAQAVKERGEGIFSVVFSVDDAEEGRAKAEEMGIGITGKIEYNSDEIKECFQDRYKTYIEHLLNPADTFGVFTVLGQLEPK